MDAARSLDNVAIALVASIYALDITATLFLIPELKGEGARGGNHLTNQIVSVRIDRAASKETHFAKPVDVGGSTPFC